MGFHSSTSQLNLSCVCQCKHPTYHMQKCAREADKWTSVSPCVGPWLADVLRRVCFEDFAEDYVQDYS
jgi:hypothetical protein